MTLAVGWIFLRIRVSRYDLAAIVLTVAGVAVLIGGDALAGAITLAELTGLFYAALATLTGAVCAIFYRPYLTRYGVLKVSVIAMAAALVPFGGMASVEAGGIPLDQWTNLTWALIVFIGLSSGIGYLLWLYALAHAQAAVVAAFLALSPVTAVLTTLWIFELRAIGSLFIALALVISGLLVLASAPKLANPTQQSR